MPILQGRLCCAAHGGRSMTVSMLLDSGADGIYLRPGLAASLGLDRLPNPWTVKTPAALQTAPAYFGAIEFDTDQGQIERLQGVVAELPTYSAGQDLLLGMGQLRHFLFVIDGPNNRFTLSRPG